MNALKPLFFFFVLVMSLVSCGGNQSSENSVTEKSSIDPGITQSQGIDNSELSLAEKEGLYFMREEEKLARDVYILLYKQWQKKVFDNIAASEQTHTDAIAQLLQKYQLDDPATGNEEGVFENIELQQLYNDLVHQGSASLINALQVGAAIEEIDLIDIQHQVDLVEVNQDIVIVYENLMKGSRNHLRAFVKSLDSEGVIYQPHYLEQSLFDGIINSAVEQG